MATRLGEHVIDLAVLLGDDVFARPSINDFMAQGYDRWVEVRARLQERLAGDVPAEAVHALTDVELHLPVEVADYVDFYASEHHAANLGRLFRPDNPDPLMPNWKHLPVGYHGRAGSIVVSGTDIPRPSGQRKGPQDPAPVFGPSVRLDIEAELGFVVGTGTRAGRDRPRRRGGPAHLRRRGLQRLVGPRHPGLGVRAPRPEPRQVVRLHRLRLGGAAARALRRPRGRPPRRSPRPCPTSR